MLLFVIAVAWRQKPEQATVLGLALVFAAVPLTRYYCARLSTENGDHRQIKRGPTPECYAP